MGQPVAENPFEAEAYHGNENINIDDHWKNRGTQIGVLQNWSVEK